MKTKPHGAERDDEHARNNGWLAKPKIQAGATR
jgi:hypothetical protein